MNSFRESQDRDDLLGAAEILERVSAKLRESEPRFSNALGNFAEEIRRIVRVARFEAMRSEISRPDEVTRTIEIKGRPEVVEKVTALLATLSWLGGIGASREIKFGWDGDGAERFEMETGLDHRKLADACRFVDDKQMCDEAKEKSGEEESMKKIDKMIESAERGADIDFLVEREIREQRFQLRDAQVDCSANIVVRIPLPEVERFMQVWPASGLPRDQITFIFDRNGDLMEETPDLSSAEGSGAAVALSNDAWDFAVGKCL